MNTLFRYLYRDGNNLKREGEVIFVGPFSQSETENLERYLQENQYFIADQVRIPEVFLWDANADYDPESTIGRPGHYLLLDADHCWHTSLGVEETSNPVTDIHQRTFGQFTEEVMAAALASWRDFEPVSRRTK